MASQQAPSVLPETAADDERRLLYQAYIDHCNAHDFEAMEKFYTTPTLNVNDEPWPTRQVTAQFKPLVEGFPDWKWEIRHFAIDGDYLSLHFRVSGTHLGAFMGHQPTGRRIEMRTMDVHQVRDGRIVTTWHLEDFAGLFAQLNSPVDAPVAAAWG